MPLTLPENKIGISLNSVHFYDVSKEHPPIDFFEIISENFMCEGGGSLAWLSKINASYPIAMSSTSLSLGSNTSPSKSILKDLKNLADKLNPFFISDYLGWSSYKGIFFNECFPLPYTQSTLKTVTKNITIAQEFIKKPILLTNPARYIAFKEHEYEEGEFLKEICKKTGCKLLLDLNNVYVSCHNSKRDRYQYLNHFPFKDVQVYRLASHSFDQKICVNSCDRNIQEGIWSLYEYVNFLDTAKPTLIRWNKKVPALSELLKEAVIAQDTLKRTTLAKEELYEVAS